MKRLIYTLLTVMFLLSVSSGSLYAVTLTFSEPDFEWYHQSVGASPYHIWVTNDYWVQTFSDTGLASATNMSLLLYIDDNVLSSGNTQKLDVVLNSVVVGSIGIASGVSGSRDYNFAFSSVPGDDYEVKLLAKNTIPPGDGSISMAADGRSYVTLTPEPSTIFLLGLGGLALLRKSRRT